MVVPFPSDDEPRTPAPAANVINFPKRTSIICIRVPPEIADEIDRRAQAFRWTRSHYCLRVLAEHIEAAQEKQGLSRIQEAA